MSSPSSPEITQTQMWDALVVFIDQTPHMTLDMDSLMLSIMLIQYENSSNTSKVLHKNTGEWEVWHQCSYMPLTKQTFKNVVDVYQNLLGRLNLNATVKNKLLDV